MDGGSIDLFTLLLVGGGVALLCGVGVVLVLGLQIVGSIFGAVGGIFEAFFNFLGGGPASWCGCIVMLGGCGLCALFAYLVLGVFSTCGTPDAVRFCQFFGR